MLNFGITSGSKVACSLGRDSPIPSIARLQGAVAASIMNQMSRKTFAKSPATIKRLSAQQIPPIMIKRRCLSISAFMISQYSELIYPSPGMIHPCTSVQSKIDIKHSPNLNGTPIRRGIQCPLSYFYDAVSGVADDDVPGVSCCLFSSTTETTPFSASSRMD